MVLPFSPIKNTSTTILSVVAYSLSGGALALSNRLVLDHFPYPVVLSWIQISATLVFLYSARFTGLLQMDTFRLKNFEVLPFVYYTILVCITLYCAITVLALSSFETLFLIRACAPCLTAALEYLFMDRQLPSWKSRIGLILLTLGAYTYRFIQDSFRPQQDEVQRPHLTKIVWSVVLLASISLEDLWGRKITQSFNFKTKSDPVFYSNLLACLPISIGAILSQEVYQLTQKTLVSGQAVVVALFLLLNCLTAISTSYATWWCRGRVSATSFTVIGVVIMSLTLLFNVKVPQPQSSSSTTAPASVLCIALCIVAGSFVYQQAPLQTVTSSSRIVASDADGIWELDPDIYDEEIELFGSQNEALITSTTNASQSSSSYDKRRPIA